jgi:hypothetical protein
MREPGTTPRNSGETFGGLSGALVDVATEVDADDAEQSTQAFALATMRMSRVVGKRIMVEVVADERTVVFTTDDPAP